jgi:hypothetical protein
MFTARAGIFSIAFLSTWCIEKLPTGLKSSPWPMADESLDTGKTG